MISHKHAPAEPVSQDRGNIVPFVRYGPGPSGGGLHGPVSNLADDPQLAAFIAEVVEIARPKSKQPPPGSVGAAKVPQPGENEDEPEPSQTKVPPLSISDFIAHSPDHTYIYRPTGEEWTSTAVNARVLPVPIGRGIKALAANIWLDRNDPVEQRTWAPGEPQIIEDKLVAEGGFFAKRGARVFNTYKPPQIITSISRDIRFWRDHLMRCGRTRPTTSRAGSPTGCSDRARRSTTRWSPAVIKVSAKTR